MTSLNGLIPSAGSSNWKKSRSVTTDSEDDTTIVRHVVIREVWLEKYPWPHAVYKIDVLSQTSHWFVFKRYKEFYQLHQKLVKLYSVPRDLLPPRKLTKNMARETLETRKEALEHYLQKLLNSYSGTVRRSEEISQFLDVKNHDVAHVTYDLAKYFKNNGERILLSKDYYRMSPSQLYCITKQRQLPHPTGRNVVDLGYLYDFVSSLKRLSITDPISQQSAGEQHEISFTFDISLFTSLKQLQMDACSIKSLRGVEHLRSRLQKLTARYCLTSMKSLLIDAAMEKRSASINSQAFSSQPPWRTHAAFKLSENRVIVQPWLTLTHVNFSHNQITSFDSSMSMLPCLQKLDLSHNQIAHLDLQMLTAPNLHTLSLANNRIYLISATTNPLENLKNLNLSHNKVQSMCGLLSCHGLEHLCITFNGITEMQQVKQLSSLPCLTGLEVAGNHFAKRRQHRIVMFAYFRGRPLQLDKKPITRKEQAKLEAKFFALENLEDMDDSISNISSVSSDESDSGFGPSQWVSNLASLSEVDEDYEVVAPSSGMNWDIESTESSAGGSVLGEKRENMSRDDWEQMMQGQAAVFSGGAKPRTVTRDSGNTIMDRKSTLTPIAPKEGVVGYDDKHLNDSCPTSSRSEQTTYSTYLRRKFDPSDNENNTQEDATVAVCENTTWKIEADVVGLIPEIKVDEHDISTSYDDNCSFERAEECYE